MTRANVQNGQQNNMVNCPLFSRKITRKKLCRDLIGPYKKRRKGKEPLELKSATMIDLVTGWFEILQYSDKKSMTIKNLV